MPVAGGEHIRKHAATETTTSGGLGLKKFVKGISRGLDGRKVLAAARRGEFQMTQDSQELLVAMGGAKNAVDIVAEAAEAGKRQYASESDHAIASLQFANSVKRFCECVSPNTQISSIGSLHSLHGIADVLLALEKQRSDAMSCLQRVSNRLAEASSHLVAAINADQSELDRRRAALDVASYKSHKSPSEPHTAKMKSRREDYISQASSAAENANYMQIIASAHIWRAASEMASSLEETITQSQQFLQKLKNCAPVSEKAISKLDALSQGKEPKTLNSNRHNSTTPSSAANDKISHDMLDHPSVLQLVNHASIAMLLQMLEAACRFDFEFEGNSRKGSKHLAVGALINICDDCDRLPSVLSALTMQQMGTETSKLGPFGYFANMIDRSDVSFSSVAMSCAFINAAKSHLILACKPLVDGILHEDASFDVDSSSDSSGNTLGGPSGAAVENLEKACQWYLDSFLVAIRNLPPSARMIIREATRPLSENTATMLQCAANIAFVQGISVIINDIEGFGLVGTPLDKSSSRVFNYISQGLQAACTGMPFLDSSPLKVLNTFVSKNSSRVLPAILEFLESSQTVTDEPFVAVDMLVGDDVDVNIVGEMVKLNSSHLRSVSRNQKDAQLLSAVVCTPGVPVGVEEQKPTVYNNTQGRHNLPSQEALYASFQIGSDDDADENAAGVGLEAREDNGFNDKTDLLGTRFPAAVRQNVVGEGPEINQHREIQRNSSKISKRDLFTGDGVDEKDLMASLDEVADQGPGTEGNPDIWSKSSIPHDHLKRVPGKEHLETAAHRLQASTSPMPNSAMAVDHQVHQTSSGSLPSNLHPDTYRHQGSKASISPIPTIVDIPSPGQMQSLLPSLREESTSDRSPSSLFASSSPSMPQQQTYTPQIASQWSPQSSSPLAPTGTPKLSSEDHSLEQLAGIGVVFRQLPGKGFIVRRLVSGGAAEVQGFVQQGDQVLAVDGQPTTNCTVRNLFDWVLGKPGTAVNLTIERNSTIHNIRLVRSSIADVPISTKAPDRQQQDDDAGSVGSGVSLASMRSAEWEGTAGQQEAENLSPDQCGIGVIFRRRRDGRYIVQSIHEGGAAEEEGSLQPGDEVFRIDDSEITGRPVRFLVGSVLGPQGSPARISFKRTRPDGDGAQCTAVLFRCHPRSPSEKDALEGLHAGVGAAIGIRDSQLVFTRVTPGGSADSAEIQVGDGLLTVDGVGLSGKSVEVIRQLLRGAPGSVVELQVVTRSGDQREVRLQRRTVSVNQQDYVSDMEQADRRTFGNGNLNSSGQSSGGGVGVGLTFKRDPETGEFFIRKIAQGSSADKCGKLEPGDIVLECDGVQLTGKSYGALGRLVLGPSGTNLELTTKGPKGGPLKRVWLERSPTSSNSGKSNDSSADASKKTKSRVGVGVVFKRSAGNFLVKRIVLGGPAERDGRLRVGDIVTAVDGQPVSGWRSTQLTDVVLGLAGSEVELSLRRGTDVSYQVTLHREPTEGSTQGNLHAEESKSDVVSTTSSFRSLPGAVSLPDQSKPADSMQGGNFKGSSVPCTVPGLILADVNGQVVIVAVQEAQGAAEGSLSLEAGDVVKEIDGFDVPSASRGRELLSGRQGTNLALSFAKQHQQGSQSLSTVTLCRTAAIIPM